MGKLSIWLERPELVPELRRLWAIMPPLSCTKISDDLSVLVGFEVTRGMVMGKAVRIGLATRGASIWGDHTSLVDELRLMWTAGKSAGVISKELTEMIHFRISRNMVIGKASRLGLPSNAKPRQNLTPNRQRREGPRVRNYSYHKRVGTLVSMQESPGIEVTEPPKTADFLGLSLMDMGPHQCRFPSGDGPQYLFCGQVTQEDSSYCIFHHSLCWNKPVPRADNIRPFRTSPTQRF